MICRAASDLYAVYISRHVFLVSGNRYLMPLCIYIHRSKSGMACIDRLIMGPELALFRTSSIKCSSGKACPLFRIVESEKCHNLIFFKYSIRFYPHGQGEIIADICLIQLQTVVAETNRFSLKAFLKCRIAVSVGAKSGHDHCRAVAAL